jgi:hypothetical protein
MLTILTIIYGTCRVERGCEDAQRCTRVQPSHSCCIVIICNTLCRHGYIKFNESYQVVTNKRKVKWKMWVGATVLQLRILDRSLACRKAYYSAAKMKSVWT